MPTTTRYRWGWESLEEKALLSQFGALFQAHPTAHAHSHTSQVQSTTVQAAALPASTGTVVGSSAGLNAGTALGNSDVQSLQQIASANNLRMFLAQLAMLKDGTFNVLQDAQALANESRDFDLALHAQADSMGIGVPADLTGADDPAAKQVLATVNTSSFGTTYLGALDQAEARLIGLLQQASTGAQDAGFRSFAQTNLPVVQARLSTEQDLPNGAVAVTGAGSVTSPSSTTLGAQDVQTLEHSYSGTLVEHFLAQVTDLQTRNQNVKLYSEKLLSDHEQEDVQLGNYAAATGSSLPGNVLVLSDLQSAQKVLNAVNHRSYDTVYLQTMVQTHTQDIASNKQTIATTQNPNLLQFAQDDIGTDFLHRLGAQSLLKRAR